MREDLQYWIALNIVPGIGARTGRAILDKWGEPSALFKADRSRLSRGLEALGLERESIESLQSGKTLGEAESILKKLEEIGAAAIAVEDEDYPALLKEIHDPPLVLYAMGNYRSAFAQPAVAVVGSRQCSTYGRGATEMLAGELAAKGIAVVSGLARGIDTAAHKAALQAGGRTIAVLGSGLDQIYPKENSALAEEICRSGALLTELPLGSPPLPQNFPFRNRIISGLSLGTLVVEAADRSGSLITARLALEQNREVFAVPGNITSSKSFGTNYLIKEGAKLVQSWRDIIEELPASAKKCALDVTASAESASLQGELFESDLSETEKRICCLLEMNEPRHIDDLSNKAGFKHSELLSALFELEMKDRIRQLPGKYFIKK